MREVILDTETTGLDPKSGHKIIEIACVEVIHKVRTGKFFHSYLNPNREVSEGAYRVHGIGTDFLKDKKLFAEIVDEFQEFLAGDPLVIHNARFDMGFLNHELSLIGSKAVNSGKIIDTLDMARRMFPGSPASLDALCKRFSVNNKHRDKHGALIDAEILADVYMNLCGGSQVEMQYGSSQVQKEAAEKARAAKNYEKREFSVSAEENEEHQEFLKKIKRPIWAE